MDSPYPHRSDAGFPAAPNRTAHFQSQALRRDLPDRDAAPNVPVVPPFTNPPSGFFYCPSPLIGGDRLGGLSPCLLETTFSAVSFVAVVLVIFGPYFAGLLSSRTSRGHDGRGEYSSVPAEDDVAASSEESRSAQPNGHNPPAVTRTDAEGHTTNEIPAIDNSNLDIENGIASAPSLRYPKPPAPVPFFITTIQYSLLTICAVSLFEMLYVLQHVLIPDSGNPGPMLRWTLQPPWAATPWILASLSWIGLYAIWVVDWREDLLVIPKYLFRWRYQGLHIFVFLLALVELYHRVQWVSRMDGIHGIFANTWRAERVADLWTGFVAAGTKLGVGLPALAPSDVAGWNRLFVLGAVPAADDGLEGMGGWTAIAGEDWSFLVCFGTRFVLLALIVILDLAACFIARGLKPGDPDAISDEDDDLLEDAGAKALKDVRRMLSKAPQTWADFFHRFRKVLRYAWPDRWAGRIALLACFGLLVVGRVVNIYVPLIYKEVVDQLSRTDTTQLPVRPLVVFAVLKVLQGGLIEALSTLCWVPVAQAITKDVSVSLFDHLMALSIRWHMMRKTGETIKIQNRGVDSVVDILNAVLLQVAPVFLDIGFACAYFATQFDSMFALIVFSTMVIYLVASFKLTNLRVRHRKASNQLENKVSGKAVDSLVNVEAVKFFANERFESGEYSKAFDDFQAMEWKVSIMSAIMSVAQVMIIQAGMLLGALECARRIVVFHSYTVGDFVLYLQYVNQLMGPLGQLQRQYRTLQRAMIDVESMLELFAVRPEVEDRPNAKELECRTGEVDFDSVSFSYDAGRRPPVIKDLTAHATPGETVALVGVSGGGKSTILRLLYRFMDVTGGSIRVDGQDIRSVTQASLRKAIGVVPQDTVLFNNTVRYNIRYGRLDASDAEVEEAAKAAQIHDRILSFENGYDTFVGERGLRLSGGERQRIGIARTALRNSRVLFLDEATSALDSNTERAIQAELNQLSKGKTTFVIAHRLSTIIHADQILVLEQGNIVERGSFDQLIEKRGLFYSMWQAQLRDPIESDSSGRTRASSPANSSVSEREQSLSPLPRTD